MNIVDRSLQPYGGVRTILNIAYLNILSTYIIPGQRYRSGAPIVPLTMLWAVQGEILELY